MRASESERNPRFTRDNVLKLLDRSGFHGRPQH